jgi:uncharacterized SAM-binding protein YcdF (DUF218 family)
MRIVKILRIAVMSVGLASLALATWLVAGCPVMVDRFLIKNETPIKAQAIICIGGGLGGHNLPLEDGWMRVYTAVQLHHDGLAPVVVFSGGGAAKLSEAEVYSEAAQWLGLPASNVVLDPTPGGTNEHPGNLLKIPTLGVTKDSPLLIVTSPLHAMRVSLCFRKSGYTNFRMITSYVAKGPDPRLGKSPDTRVIRELRTSSVDSYRPNGKSYDDPINRLRWGLNTLLSCARETIAIAVYKFRGYA